MRIRGGENGEGNIGRGLFWGARPSGAPRRLYAEARDNVDATLAEQRAIELLGAAKRYRVTAGRKERMWLRLMPLSGRGSRRLSRPLLATGVLTALLGGSAIAGGALGYLPAWTIGLYARLLPGLALNQPSAATMPTFVSGLRGPKARSRAAGDGGNAAMAAGEQAVAGQGPAAAQAETSSRRDAGPSTRARHSPRMLPTDDVTQVAAALRALRQDRDPSRARALLNSYLVAHPAGVLAEEALAISIEAALAAHDGDAPTLAARYLRLYPRGYFRSLSRDVIASSPDR